MAETYGWQSSRVSATDGDTLNQTFADFFGGST
jgi:hypothetical protein